MEKETDKYKVVVIENNLPQGKYIVTRDKKDSYLFLAVNLKMIGTHAHIFDMFKTTQESSRENKQSFNKLIESYSKRFYGRDKLIEALKKIPQFPDMKKVIGGGHYSHINNNLRLFGSSANLGGVDDKILEEFRKPIQSFYKEKNIPLESLVIESSPYSL